MPPSFKRKHANGRISPGHQQRELPVRPVETLCFNFDHQFAASASLALKQGSSVQPDRSICNSIETPYLFVSFYGAINPVYSAQEISGARGATQSFAAVRKRLAQVKFPSAADQLLLDAAVEIKQNPEATETAFMARQLVQCTLPHSDPGDIPIWTRTNGNLRLVIQPHIDRQTRKALYPFGSVPRLFLFWLVTEAKRKKSRHIRLGNSLDTFMREIGLNPTTGGGKRGDAKRLQNQMRRLIDARISFESETESHGRYLHMNVSSRAEFWWNSNESNQANLWESWIELGEEFYEAVTLSSVPVDLRALRALKRSPLALDLYAWLTYTAFVATKARRPRTVRWEALHAQMGTVKSYHPHGETLSLLR